MILNNLLDPVKIVMCGGSSVGKTSILRRLAEMRVSDEYEPTTGVNIVNFSIPMRNSNTLKLQLVDIGADLIHCQSDSPFFSTLTSNMDGFILVIDGTSASSMKDSDAWLQFFAEKSVGKVFKYLLVHKADLPQERRILSSNQLDLFVHHAGLIDWALTVGHSQLGDLDFKRGNPGKQKSPEEVIKRMLIVILQQRQSNFHKIFPISFRIDYVSWLALEFEDLEKVGSYNA